MAAPSATQIAEIAASEGKQGLVRLVRDHLTIFREDPNLAESLYWRVKEQVPGAAFLFAFLMSSKGVVLPGVYHDLTLMRQADPGLWATGIAHMRSTSVLGRAREALEAGDVICGYHYRLGGCGPTPVVFTSFLGFEEHLRSTRPGDKFTLLSVQQLAGRNALIDPTVDAVKQWLSGNPAGEVLLLKTKSRPPQVEVIWREREDEEDEKLDRLFTHDEGLLAVPLSDGLEYFINAKTPNEKGQIPVSGAY